MNTINAIALAVPTFVVLIGILMNRQETAAIRSELRSVENSLRNEMIQLRKDLNADMLQLRKDLSSEMIQLRDSIHTDMVGLHERIAVVEAKQQS